MAGKGFAASEIMAFHYKCMDVLVDANVMLANGINSTPFKALCEYLRRTRSTLLVPGVVLEELCAHRRRGMEKLKRDIDGVQKDLRRLFPEATAKLPVLDIDKALNVYRKELLTSAEKTRVLDNDPKHLAELVRRLTRRIPPASADGEEARDVLVWLTLVEAASERNLAFITGDRRAFFQDEKLREELLNDLVGFENDVEAFYGLDAFLRAHHARSSFVDKKWLMEQIETKEVSKAIEHFVDVNGELFTRQLEDKGEPTGWLSLTQLVQYELEDYFVSDVGKNVLYVAVTLWAELEIEAEYVAPIEPREWGEEPREEPRLRFIYLQPCVRFQIQLEVIDKKLASVAISDMEFA